MECSARSRRSGTPRGLWTATGLVLALALGGCTKASIKMHPDGGDDLGSSPDLGLDHGTDERTDVATGQGGSTAGTGGALGTGGVPGAGGGGAGTGGAPGTGGGIAGSSGTGGANVDLDAGLDAALDASIDAPAGIAPSAAGQLVITEIMGDSAAVSDDSGEWFEVYNPGATDTLDLYRCELFDTANMHVVTRHVLIAPHAFATLARFGDISGGFVPDYNYNPTGCTSTCGTNCPMGCPTVKFGNGGDQVGVKCGATVIDLVDFRGMSWLYGGPPLMIPHGQTYSLDPRHYDATDNDAPANWCLGMTSYHMSASGMDLGTPGTNNPLCAFD